MSKESKKVRTTIAIDKILYEELDELGIISGRRISQLVNQLLMDYLQNKTINQLELRSRNFIEKSVEKGISRALTITDNKLNHLYQIVNFIALLSVDSSDMTPSEVEKTQKRVSFELSKLLTSQVFKEKFLEENWGKAGVVKPEVVATITSEKKDKGSIGGESGEMKLVDKNSENKDENNDDTDYTDISQFF